MSKSSTKPYGLRVGHSNTFRRTVTVGSDKKEQRVQLVFEPNTPLDLTAQEVDGLQQELAEGIIVPWEEHNRKLQPTAPPTRGDSDLMKSLLSENEGLRNRLEALESENGTLRAKLHDDTDLDGDDAEATSRKRSVRIADLEISEGTRAALEEAGLTTAKKIADHKAKHGSLDDVPGIGEARAVEIDEAIAATE